VRIETPLDPAGIVRANTELQSPPLCAEIQLLLLKQDAPLLQASSGRLFDESGPRPYWAFCWGSGQALARYLLDHPCLVQNRCVLDFGSGSGIAAIAAAKAGAAEVRAADVDPLALAAIEINADHNRVSVSPCNRDTVQTDDRDWDVLLAGDVCYLGSNCDWLRRRDYRDGLILIGDPGRPGLPSDRLEELARFSVRTVPDLEHPDLKEAAVYRFSDRVAALTSRPQPGNPAAE